MLLFFACIFCIVFLVIIVIMASIPPDSGNQHSRQTKEKKTHTSQSDEYDGNSYTEHMIANGDIPDWNDLSDEQKTKLSVWSEKGEPLEDIHLFDK